MTDKKLTAWAVGRTIIQAFDPDLTDTTAVCRALIAGLALISDDEIDSLAARTTKHPLAVAVVRLAQREAEWRAVQVRIDRNLPQWQGQYLQGRRDAVRVEALYYVARWLNLEGPTAGFDWRGSRKPVPEHMGGGVLTTYLSDDGKTIYFQNDPPKLIVDESPPDPPTVMERAMTTTPSWQELNDNQRKRQWRYQR